VWGLSGIDGQLIMQGPHTEVYRPDCRKAQEYGPHHLPQCSSALVGEQIEDTSSLWYHHGPSNPPAVPSYRRRDPARGHAATPGPCHLSGMGLAPGDPLIGIRETPGEMSGVEGGEESAEPCAF
jgi:hypothetical protein